MCPESINIVVLPGRDGKLLIDAGFAGARPKIIDALAGISPNPIKHLINTHWHFDHTDGMNGCTLPASAAERARSDPTE